MSTNYNGIITKVRAMDSKLLTEDDFQNILLADSVPEAINYLREHTEYHTVFESYDNLTHREQIEELLSTSLYNDFSKLYQFAYSSQRTYLSILYERFELNILKSCITDLVSDKKSEHYNTYPLFMVNHADFNIEQLYQASSLEEFISYMSNTKYYKLLKTIYDHGVTNFVEYRSQLDIFFYSNLWSKKGKLLTGECLKAMTELVGREIDLLNIIWIYRCKKYYDVEPSVIINNYIIPVSYKLSKKEMLNLIDSVTLNDFSNILSSTCYGKSHYRLDINNIEDSFYKILLDTHKACTRHYPKSMSPISSYLFKKQIEIDRITTAIECVRYNVKR